MNTAYPPDFSPSAQEGAPDAPAILRLCAATVDVALCAALFVGVLSILGRFLPAGLDHDFVTWFYGDSFNDVVPAKFETSYTTLLVRGATLVGLGLTIVASYHIRGDFRGATFGKLVFGLRLRSRDLTRVTRARAIVRCVGKFLVFGLCSIVIGGPLFFFAFVIPEEFLAHYLLTLPLLVFAMCSVRFTRKGGTFHDIFSQIRVLRRRDLPHNHY